MKSGELAARLRTNAEAVKRHKAFTREWKDAVAIQRSALFTNLPLILAALDLAAADLEYAGRKGHVDRYIEKTKARKALRRAEEAAP